jgi:hypothetical protein
LSDCQATPAPRRRPNHVIADMRPSHASELRSTKCSLKRMLLADRRSFANPYVYHLCVPPGLCETPQSIDSI